MSSQSSRRRFLTQAAIASGLSAHLVHHGFAWEPPTASATKGPFYPIPEIAKQKYYDADLTRLRLARGFGRLERPGFAGRVG